jgi:hypothetical protein
MEIAADISEEPPAQDGAAPPATSPRIEDSPGMDLSQPADAPPAMRFFANLADL